jgi:lysozyme
MLLILASLAAARVRAEAVRNQHAPSAPRLSGPAVDRSLSSLLTRPKPASARTHVAAHRNPFAHLLHGVDVSNWNHVVKWRRVRSSGQTFAIMKATEGRTFVDPKYARNRRRALRAGLVVAAYHFARPDRRAHDAKREADHFLKVARVRAGDIVPVLDLETNGDLTRRQLIHWTWAWLNEVRRRTGVRPMIYTGSLRWRTEMRNTQRFARAGYPLWLASWTTESPQVPAHNWAGHGWTFWQHGACGHIPGIRKCVDLDRFRGSDLASVRVPSGLAAAAIARAPGLRTPSRCGPACLLRDLRRRSG